jgi:glycosyltransferase involved in cell wall biosynthesis
MRVLCSAILRIKNEARWIRQVLEAIQPICHKIFIMDDNSTDNTIAICSEFPNVIVKPSPFTTLDESRDKNWIYDQALCYPEYANRQWPHWLLCIDGDEVLDARDSHLLYELMTSPREIPAMKFKIIYLWNETMQRVDGVYNDFCRPSAFRIINPGFRFQSTPFGNGANFHCSSIPQELLYQAVKTDVRLTHLGYMDKENRIRKWNWYNQIDPGNIGEGFDPSHPERGAYPHIVQGDIPEVPAGVRLMHAGPLTLKPLV